MDQKIVIAAAGVGAAVVILAIVFFFVLGRGTVQGLLPGSRNSNSTSPAMQDLVLAVRNVNVTKQDEANARVLVAFEAGNPNPSTAVLENIHYTLSVDGYQMTSGDTGEVLEGFLGSQATAIPIVPNGMVLIKNEQVATKNNLTASSWDSMVAGTAKYSIEGWYAVRTTSSLQTNYQEKNFKMSYPNGQ